MGNKSKTYWNTFPYSQVVNRYKNGLPPTLYRSVSTGYNRTGVNNPNRFKHIDMGVSASTNMSVSASEISLVPPSDIVNYTVREPPSWYGYRTYDESIGLLNWIDISVTGHFGSQDPVANSLAISSLYRKLQNAHHQFQGGVFVGEFRKTAKMILGSTRKLASGISGFLSRVGKPKKGKPGPPSGGSLQNSYLEAVFGWLPLINDCKDGAIAIARILDKGVEPIRFRAMGRTENQIFQAPGTIPGSGSTFHTLEVRSMETRSIYYGAFRGGASEEARIRTQAERVISLSGFDLRSFIPTVWELIPYSFLVDYFLNVGEFLEAMNTDTSQVAWLSHVSKLVSKSNLIIAYKGPTPAQIQAFSVSEKSEPSFNGKSGSCVRKFTTITRTASTPVPFLMPRFKLTEISGKQVLNMIALFTR